MSANFLKMMRDKTKARIIEEKYLRKPHSFLDIFSNNEMTIIAQIHFANPLQGKIAEVRDVVCLAEDYFSHGAHALAILTEPQYFHGSFSYLKRIRNAYPNARLLMKDFILDEVQLLQGLMSGADAVLLIASFLSHDELKYLYQQSLNLGLTPLVEVNTIDELRFAEYLGAQLIGVNNRNLRTLEIDLNTSSQLIAQRSSPAIMIAMSGISSGKEIKALKDQGYQGVLIGNYCMAQAQPGRALQNLIIESKHAD